MNVVFYLNSKRIQLHEPDPTMTLYEFLRRRRLFGARAADKSSTSGMDVVTVARMEGGKVIYRSVPALKTYVAQLHGAAVYTVEGIGTKSMLHPIQQEFVNCESFQCGYCAGGFSMAMYTLLRNNPHPTEAEILQALDGNMCRCTAFSSIAAAVASFGQDIEEFPIHKGKPKVEFKPENEPAFPEELKTLNAHVDYKFEQLSEEDGSAVRTISYVVPQSVEELKEVMKREGEKTIIASTSSRMLRTSVCNPVTKKEYNLVNVKQVKEWKDIKIEGKKVTIGSSVTYAELLECFEKTEQKQLKEIAEVLRMFRNTPLRNI